MGTVKKQKRARKSALKNRYCAGAKLSEHKFLRILHGYADGMTIQELATTTHVSSRTIRATYGALRERLAGALLEEPEKFGSAGKLLAGANGERLLDTVRRSAHFRPHRKRYAPRMTDEEEKLLLAAELLVRLLCTLDLREVGFLENENSARKIVLSLTDAIPRLNSREPLQKLAEAIPGAKPFAHPGSRVYEDYRRYLLKYPLGVQ